MRIGFAGTPEFAAVHLQALLEQGWPVELVLTQPDRRAGRGKHLTAPPVKQIAQTQGIPVLQPPSLQSPDIVATLAAARLDILIVVAYGLLLPETVLNLPKHGCLNVHASLLPRWRGAAPIQRAILAGDKVTGISLMKMDKGLDTGPLYATREIAILPSDTGQTLHDRLAALGAQCLNETLPSILAGQCQPTPQPQEGATYAPKLQKSEARIDWHKPAIQLAREVRAFNPWPVSFVALSNPLRIWAADAIAEPCREAPGTLLKLTSSGIDVATGEGILRIQKLQPAGKRVMQTHEWLSGHGQQWHTGARWP